MQSNDEEQLNELEALAAIYGDDFIAINEEENPENLNQKEEISDNSKNKKWYKISILPFPNTIIYDSDHDEEVSNENERINYLQVCLKFQFVKDYPSKKPPHVVVEKIIDHSENITDSVLRSLQKSVESKAKEMIGQVMIYELVQFIQESIIQYNSPPSIISLHDEMIKRQKSKVDVDRKDSLDPDENSKSVNNNSSHENSMISNLLNESIDELASQEEYLDNKPTKGVKSVIKVKGNDKIGQMIAEELKRQEALKLSSDLIPLTSSASSVNSSSSNNAPSSDQKSPAINNKQELDSKQSKKEREILDSSSSESIGNNSSQEIPKPISEGNVVHPNITNFSLKWQKKGDVTEINKLSGIDIKCRLFTAINLNSSKPMIVKEFAIYASNSAVSRDKVLRIAQSIHQLHSLSHVNILNYIGCQVDECDTFYLFRIFQEYSMVSNMEKIVESYGHIEEQTIRKITRQMITALAFLHMNKVSHQAIQLGNILIDSSGRIKLSDFGISYLLQELIALEENSSTGLKNVNYYSLLSNANSDDLDMDVSRDTNSRASVDRDSSSSAAFQFLAREDLYQLGLALIEMSGGSYNSTKNSLANSMNASSIINVNIPDHLSSAAKEFISTCLNSVSSSQSENDTSRQKPDSHIQTLLSHRFISDISESLHDFIPYSPPASFGGYSVPTAKASKSQKFSNHMELETKSNSNGIQFSVNASILPTNQLNPPTASVNPIDSNPINIIRRDVTSSGDTLGSGKTPFFSRYKTDFDEIEELGSGGFGVVLLARNKLDGREYAIKKIRLSGKQQTLAKVIREVTTLSRLNHQFVVRYYQAWIENEGDDEVDRKSDDELGVDDDEEEEEEEEKISEDESKSAEDDWFENDDQEENSQEDLMQESHLHHSALDLNLSLSKSFSKSNRKIEKSNKKGKKKESEEKNKRITLYIQMEYCSKRTLRQLIDDPKVNISEDEEERYRILRQIVEGLHHIHVQGIIHRDLKPSNIFLDQNGDVKIGDFGLATSGGMKVGENEKEEEEILDENDTHTQAVGTPFYTAPEQEKSTSGHYDFKVDMYSLGIIFFEMCQTFSTAMERFLVLSSLRKENKFPNGFDTKYSNEYELIKRLLESDSQKRPSTLELLQSNLLPSQIEEEILKEALAKVANPSTTIFSTLLNKLFSLPPDKQYDLSYEYHLDNGLTSHESVTRDQICIHLVKICRKHGGLHIETPLLIPKNSISPSSINCHLLDDTGTILSLNSDLTLPFARHVARNKITNMKRYNIGRVYRKHFNGGKPRELLEMSFDIVFPNIVNGSTSSLLMSMSYDAEVLKVLTEALDGLQPQIGRYYIRVNHTSLFDGILTLCGVDQKNFPQVRAAISNLSKKAATIQSTGSSSLSSAWNTIASKIISEDFASKESVDAMRLYFVEISSISDLVESMALLEPLVKKSKLARDSFLELKFLVRHLHSMKIANRVRLDLSCMFSYSYYSGVVFQAVMENEHQTEGTDVTSTSLEIISAGGRYDKLISSFLPGSSSSSGPQAACATGVNISIDRLLSLVLSYDQKVNKAVSRHAMDIDILVCNMGVGYTGGKSSSLLDDRLEIANTLWSLDLKCEYNHPPFNSLEELSLYCSNNGIQYMIILQEKLFHTQGLVRVREVSSKVESQVKLKELPQFMLSLITKTPLPTQLQSPPPVVSIPLVAQKSASSPGGDHVPNTQPSLDIVIANVELNSKALRKISTMATARVMPSIKRLMISLPVIKVFAVELPMLVLKEVVTLYNGDGTPFLEKYPRNKDNLLFVLSILSRHKNLPLIVFYNYKEDDFEMRIQK